VRGTTGWLSSPPPTGGERNYRLAVLSPPTGDERNYRLAVLSPPTGGERNYRLVAACSAASV